MNDQLRLLLEIKYCLEHIAAIGEEQSREIVQGNAAQLNTLLERKDELIRRIRELYKTLNSQLSRGSLKHPDIAEVLSEIDTLTGRIIKDEHKSLHKTMCRRQKVNILLHQASNGKKVLDSYVRLSRKKKSDLHWKG
jgi:hypothetical protein